MIRFKWANKLWRISFLVILRSNMDKLKTLISGFSRARKACGINSTVLIASN